ncbi:MAG: Ig-like domain-containing protein [Clostridia bacterium]
MKKIIIGMLLLLPLIIVASVLFAIDIITVEAYIAVDRVELNHSTLELSLSDGHFDGFEATVYPTAAKNKKVTWEISDIIPTVDYEGDIAYIDPNTGRLELHSYGTFTVIATTAEGNKKAICNVYIKGDKVQDIELTSAKSNLQTGESVWLTAVFRPIDAVVKDIEWRSSNPNVIKIDQNGIATAKRVGEAVISVTTEGIEKSITLTSSQGISYYGSPIYLSASSFKLSDITPHNITNVSGGYIEGGNFYFTSEVASLHTSAGSIALFRSAEDDIVIENASFFEDYKFKVGKLPLILSAIYKDATRGGAQEVLWTSSHPNIAEIDGEGRVSGKANGFVTFTAQKGGKSASVEIEIVKPISVIVLAKNAETEKRGILEKTVYGNRRYGANGLEAEVIDIGVIFPADATADDFIYQTDDPALAVFEEDGKLKLHGDFSVKKTVQITLTAKVSPYESVSVSRSYTFAVDNGVNCYTYDDVRRAVEDEQNIYLRNDIEFGASESALELKSNLHGNGYILDGINYNQKKQDYTMLHIVASGVTVSNLRIRNDEAERISMPNGLRGYVIVVGNREEGEFLTDVRIEYSILENGYYALALYRAEVTVDGCIMRNASNFGIFIESGKEGETLIYSNVTLNNSVMSNIVAPAIGVSVTSPTDTHSTLKSTGFLDIYNWQDISNMRMLDRDFVQNNEAMNNVLKQAVTSLLQSEFKKDRYNHLRYVGEDGTYYLHLGIITAGALHPCETVPEIEDERYKAYDIEVLHDSSILPIKLHPVFLYNYLSTSPEIKPGDEPVENKTLYQKLRGEL